MFHSLLAKFWGGLKHTYKSSPWVRAWTPCIKSIQKDLKTFLIVKGIIKGIDAINVYFVPIRGTRKPSYGVYSEKRPSKSFCSRHLKLGNFLKQNRPFAPMSYILRGFFLCESGGLTTGKADLYSHGAFCNRGRREYALRRRLQLSVQHVRTYIIEAMHAKQDFQL